MRNSESQSRGVGPAALLSPDYGRLPPQFFARLLPGRVRAPELIAFNQPLARDLGFDAGALDRDALAATFAGNALLPGAEPLAMAYAGHQFGQFVPQLGDGRALLLGELLDRTGQRREIQLKGAGRTPYSRGGDGRAALGPVLREYLLCEAMHALGIPTTRALAAVASGEQLYRDGLVPGAVLTRVAASHVRVGTFEYFAARGDQVAVRQLADFVISRHYPSVRAAEQPYLALLQAVSDRQAALIAAWMGVGFIHGVMNTDNMAVSGETIDFGPCAFLDTYDPDTVFSSIDQGGRYAYANQPLAAQWNLARFAETLLPLIDQDPERALSLATTVIRDFLPNHAARWSALMCRKLGLAKASTDDESLISELLGLMHAQQVDFTRFFRGLSEAAADPAADRLVRQLFTQPHTYDAWASRWRARLAGEPLDSQRRASQMRQVNPWVIPRNHRVEQALAAASQGRYGPFSELLQVLAQPFEELPELAYYANAPSPEERVLRTFCGT